MTERRCFRRRAFGLAALGLAGALGFTSSVAAANMLFILDGSNSMWGQVDGVPKIETAKNVLGNLLRNLPEGTRAGFMAYGHTTDGTCKDVQLISGIGAEPPEALAEKIRAITPRGKTPIAYALKQSEAAFAGFVDEQNYVVLISDGVETCLGDPCAAAAELASKGYNVKVHVVGFDVSADERKQLECIAENGKGRYWNASTVADFTRAIEDVKKETVAAPAPQVAQAETIFFDDFDGDALKDHWELLNPNEDAYIVEEGELLLVAAGNRNLQKGDIENMIRLKSPMPKGNWVATVKFRTGYQTGREAVYLALYADTENFIAASDQAWSYFSGLEGARLFLNGVKRKKGKETKFSKKVWGGSSGVAFDAESPPNPILLRITKKGRTYTPAIMLEAKDGSGKWIELESFTDLRQKGRLTIAAGQSGNVEGETTTFIDWVKIEPLK